MTRHAAVTWAVAVALAAACPAADLDGTWLVRDARFGGWNRADDVWKSIVRVKSGRFTMTNLCGTGKSLRGRCAVAADGKTVKLKWGSVDLNPDIAIDIPAAERVARFRHRGDRLRLAFLKAGGPPPTSFEPSKAVVVLELWRAPAGFKAFPETVKVRVLMPDGTPAVGATAGTFLHRCSERGGVAASKLPAAQAQASLKVKTVKGVTAGDDGVVEFQYADLDGRLVARDAAGRLVAMTGVSPAELFDGAFTLLLQPACRLTARIDAPKSVEPGFRCRSANVIVYRNGVYLADFWTFNDRFALPLPAGDYYLKFDAHGLDPERRRFQIETGSKEFHLPPLKLKPARLEALRGRPAPPLRAVHGWKGEPVKLADLKGHVVLLDFWASGAARASVRCRNYFSSTIGLRIAGWSLSASTSIPAT